MNNYTVYKHVNKTNGKTYIGITGQRPEDRWSNGCNYRCGTYIHNAIQKYSWNGFYHEIVASNITHEEAINLEKSLIKELDTLNPKHGYNLTSGGEGGYKLATSAKIKIGVANKKRWSSEEYRTKRMQYLSSDENRERLADVHSGKAKKTEERVAAVRAKTSNRGRRRKDSNDLTKPLNFDSFIEDASHWDYVDRLNEEYEQNWKDN